MSDPNSIQVGGSHYKSEYQHWDWVDDAYIRYYEAVATKYITRWRKKNGLQDLQKSIHYIDKCIVKHDTNGRCSQAAFTKPRMDLLSEFGVANKIGMEMVVLELIANWRLVEDLKAARQLVETMIEREEIRTICDVTCHPSPFGYEPEEDNIGGC